MVSNVLTGSPFELFGKGDIKRDFTYIDDIAEGVTQVLDKAATPIAPSKVQYRIFNIGNHDPVLLLDFIACLERSLGREATKELLPMQDGDVRATYADVSALEAWVGFKPTTPLVHGIKQFAEWYRTQYAI
jgi:UDP-glucuronate 4-epimerase